MAFLPFRFFAALPSAASGWVRRTGAQCRRLIPSSCVLCGQHAEETLCDGCRQQFFTVDEQRCTICAIPLPHAGAHHRCGECMRTPPAFDACVVAGNYAAPLDQLVLSLKFGGKLALAPLMARMLADALLRLRGNAALPSLLMPVPLSEKRLQVRGFNQTLEIARPLARLTGIPLAPQLMRRTRDTLPQSLLSPDQRRSNVEGAFDLSPGFEDSVCGRHLGIVDDVITTGQTLNDIALALKRNGAARVTNLVFARTLR